MSGSDGPFRIISVLHCTLKFFKIAVANTTSIDREPVAPFRNKNANVGEERSSVEGEEKILTNKHYASERKVAESERYDTGDSYASSTPNVNDHDEPQPLQSNVQEVEGTSTNREENIHENQPRKCNCPDGDDGSDECPTLM